MNQKLKDVFKGKVVNKALTINTIKNFRGIREGRITFGRHTVLVGPNSSGKTTLIEALTTLFGRDRLIRTLTEHDFFGCDPQPPKLIGWRYRPAQVGDASLVEGRNRPGNRRFEYIMNQVVMHRTIPLTANQQKRYCILECVIPYFQHGQAS